MRICITWARLRHHFASVRPPGACWARLGSKSGVLQGWMRTLASVGVFPPVPAGQFHQGGPVLPTGLLALAAQATLADGEGVSVDGIGQALQRLAQRLGGTRLGVLAIGRILSPLQRGLYHRTGGRLSLTGHAPVLLLTTTGRRTGKGRTVPLLYLRDDDRLIICNVNPGFERPNPWVVNLRAQPHAQVQIGHGTTSVNARPASEDELDRYWPELTKMWPAYQAFYGNGGKRSVFVLEPDGLLPQVFGAKTMPGNRAGSAVISR